MSALDEAVKFYLEQTGGLSEHETAKQAEAELIEIRKKISEISRPASPPVITANASTVQFPCSKCGNVPHTIFTMGSVDVCQCTKCNAIAAVS